ncbi:Sulfotransferase domain [Trinorchestia longiramus]|nr:Sulfotransferase domain [Trinorchestia longiramus]
MLTTHCCRRAVSAASVLRLPPVSAATRRCYSARRRKQERRELLLEQCVRVPLPPGHYEPNIVFYRYCGYVLPGQIIMSGVMRELPDFKARNSDVIVASFPKTGTTWVQEIVYMLTHGCRASNDDDPTLETRFPYLEYPYPGLKTVSAMPGLRCIKTHLPYTLLPPSVQEAGAKVVYVSRNPRDTCVSYYHFARLLTSAGFIGSLADFVDDFLDDRVPYSPFSTHVLEYHEAQKANDSVLCVSYEQLTADPASVVRSLANHLNVAVSDEDVKFVVTHTSFAAMSSNKSVNYEHWKDVGFAHKDRGNFLRKGKIGDWQTSLTPDQVVRFEAWEKQKLPREAPFTYTLSEALSKYSQER